MASDQVNGLADKKRHTQSYAYRSIAACHWCLVRQCDGVRAVAARFVVRAAARRRGTTGRECTWGDCRVVDLRTSAPCRSRLV